MLNNILSFALSSQENYSDVEGKFSMREFYDDKLDFIVGNNASEFREDLLKYWNE